jgi:hypothetical protein
MASLSSPEQILQDKQACLLINQLLDELNDRESLILKRRFGFEGEPLTLREIGDEIGRHHQTVAQIEAKALRKLKHPSKVARLRNVLDHPCESSWKQPPRKEAPQPDIRPRGFSDWLAEIRKHPDIRNVKPWTPADFQWLYVSGLSAADAVAFAVEFDAAPKAARQALFKRIRAQKFIR